MKRPGNLYLMFAVILIVLLALGFFNPVAAQTMTERDRELEEVRAAIRVIPDVFSLTEADRPAVIQASILAENWMAKYGASRLEICALSGRLMAAMAVLGMGDGPLPPTGGFSLLGSIGLLSVLAGSAILIPRKRRQ